MTKKDYATQIWPFREDFGKDMPATLQKLADMGFAGVELCRWFDWTDLFDKWPADDLRDVSQRVGLEIVSSHIPSYMLQPERLDELAQFCEVVGMKYVMVASLPADQRQALRTRASLRLEDGRIPACQGPDIGQPIPVLVVGQRREHQRVTRLDLLVGG